MRIIFMGTPHFAVPSLQAIIANGHDVVACYTQPPRPAGRGQIAKPGPVQMAAMDGNIEVFTPNSLKNPEEQKLFASHKADVAIVVAYGLLLPLTILQAPEFGCLNLHGSKLPRWRGAAPIQRAIMAGDTTSAVEIMQMDEGLDTGDIALSAPIAIGPDTSAGELHDEMMMLGADLIVKALIKLEKGQLQTVAQSTDGVTYAKKIAKSEARIDWNQLNITLHNLVRGLSPYPGAWSEFQIKGKPVRVKILQTKPIDRSGKAGEILRDETGLKLSIACGQGALEILRVQRAGGGPMSASDFIRGTGDLSGQILAVA